MQVSGGHGGLVPAVGLPGGPVDGLRDGRGPEGGGLTPHGLGLDACGENLLGLP